MRVWYFPTLEFMFQRIITSVKFNRLRSFETSFELKLRKLILGSCCLRSFESSYSHKLRQLGMPPPSLSRILPSVELFCEFVCTALYSPVTQRLRAGFSPLAHMLQSRGTLSRTESRVKRRSHGFVMTIDNE
jgi:hypothetical protein